MVGYRVAVGMDEGVGSTEKMSTLHATPVKSQYGQDRF
jgi:hypothetical protein